MGCGDPIRLGLHSEVVKGLKRTDSVFYFHMNMLIWAIYQSRYKIV